MKVILNKTVPKVGKEGQVVTVADGFARNFLFPRGLAILAERKQVASLEKRNARVEARTADVKAAAEELKTRLDGQTVRIEAKVGTGTKLFGAITSQDIVDAVKSQLKMVVDKKQVALIEPIKRLGSHPVELDLHRSVDAHIVVVVFDPLAVVETVEAKASEIEPQPEPVEA